MNQHNLEPLLNTKDVVHWLGVKESTIRKKVCYARIPCVRIGRMVRFSKSEIERFYSIREGKINPPFSVEEKYNLNGR